MGVFHAMLQAWFKQPARRPGRRSDAFTRNASTPA